MADIQYLNYGDLQIELLAFNDIINDELKVLDYVNSQPWSEKRKRYFMDNYYNMRKRGITGASIEDVTDENGGKSTKWVLHVNGSDPEFRDKKDKEMQGEVAYFIQQQMSKLPTKSSLEEQKKKKEEEDKSKFPVFDFNKDFITHVNNSINGGQPLTIGGARDLWNYLDERNSDGIRGRKKRADKLAELLDSYKRKLGDGSKYNFEGSPYSDINDFNSRIDKAIAALKSDSIDDDREALQAIGLNQTDWFNNGSGDPSGKYITLSDGTQRELSYAELAKYNLDLAKLKTELEAEANKKKLMQQLANRFNYAVRSNIKMVGQNPQVLALKYKNDQGILNQLSLYAQSTNITPEQWSEILGAYKFYNSKGVLLNLSRLELDSFNGLRNYNGLGPGVLKKLPGVNGLYFDTRTGLVIKAGRREQQALQPILGLLELQNPEHLLLQYMNSTEGGFTPAELREVAALLFDLGAAADPEGFSSAGLSQIAAGIRDYNRASDPEGWTWGDTGWAILDHGLGLLSAIPVAGGLIKGSWAAAKLGNYIPKMEKWIRLAGRAGSTYAMAANAPGALNTLNKIKNGEDLSLKDCQDLAYFFIGGLGHHQLNRGNRVERSAMKARGIETSNSILNKAGITRTKAKTTSSSETTPTLKVLKTGEDGKVDTKEIPITKEQKVALGKAKPDKLSEAAVEAKISNIPEGYTIVKPTITSGWRSRINTAKSWFGEGNSEIFGTPTNSTINPSALKTDEEFEQYLSEHNNTWLKKFFNGSNRDIRRYDRYLGNNSVKPTEQLSETSKATETSEKSIAELRKSVKGYLEGTAKHSGNNLSEEPFKAGDFNFEVNKFPNSSAGNIDISFNGNVMGNISFKNLEDMMKKVANFLKENRRLKDTSGTFIKRINAKEMGEILKQLKAKGVFKQGGTIDKQKIQKYKEFIKK